MVAGEMAATVVVEVVDPEGGDRKDIKLSSRSGSSFAVSSSRGASGESPGKACFVQRLVLINKKPACATRFLTSTLARTRIGKKT